VAGDGHESRQRGPCFVLLDFKLLDALLDGAGGHSGPQTAYLCTSTSSTPQAAGESQASNPSSTVIQTGTANGIPASQTAILKLYGAHAIYEPYTHRAFKITGQLLNNQEQPIAGATLDLLQQTSDSNTVTPLQLATTRPNGTFTAPIPQDPPDASRSPTAHSPTRKTTRPQTP